MKRLDFAAIGLALVVLAGGCNSREEMGPGDVRRFFRERSLEISDEPTGREVEDALRALVKGVKGFDEICERLRLKELPGIREGVCQPEFSSVLNTEIIGFTLSHYRKWNDTWTRYSILMSFDADGEVRIHVVPAVGGEELADR